MNSVIAIAALALFSVGASAKVEIKGNNTQTVTVKNGAIVNSAAGMGAKAKMTAASVTGNVSIGGNNKQTLDVKNGAIVNSAAGMGVTSEMNLGSVTGK